MLSLFFIDKVANYRAFDEQGNPTLGPIGRWFEEAYGELTAQPRYAKLTLPPVEDVHDGYFSVDNKGVYKDTRGTGETDSTTYDLIMRDKERLLDIAEPLRFIFSHSAARGLGQPQRLPDLHAQRLEVYRPEAPGDRTRAAPPGQPGRRPDPRPPDQQAHDHRQRGLRPVRPHPPGGVRGGHRPTVRDRAQGSLREALTPRRARRASPRPDRSGPLDRGVDPPAR